MKNSFFLIIALVFVAVIFIPRAVLAEIATTRDWIGLFEQHPSKDCKSTEGSNPADTAETCRAKTVSTTTNDTFKDSHTWVYTSTCSQATPGPNTPPRPVNLVGCRIAPDPMPAPPPGTYYAYRMYANDKGSKDTLIAQSRTMTVGVGATAGGGGGGVPCPTQSPYPRVREGLISTPVNVDKFGNSLGQCVIDNQAAFAPYKIPTYEDLKSLYYTQSKLTKNTSLLNAFNADGIYNLPADLTISSPSFASGNGTAIIFIEGNLNIGPISNNKLITGNNTGLVFVVKGNVNIASSVTQIDAVIISQGTIYTAGAGCSLAANIAAGTTNSRLIVNGSLISLDSTKPPVFCRTLGTNGAINDNNTAAELINNQPKYLVILRDLMSDTLQKWSEIQ